jgi:hypothetical protein
MLKGKPFEEAGLPKLFKPTVERLTSEKNFGWPSGSNASS